MKFLIFLSFVVVSEACNQVFDNAFMIFVGNSKNDYVNVSSTGDFSKLRGAPAFLTTIYGNYYNPSLKTIMYISGWRSNYDSEDADAMINAFLVKKSQYNIVYVDWYNYTNNFAYVTSLSSIDGVSKTIYNIMDTMSKDSLINFDKKNVHVIGFSLGAHLANHIAKQVQDNSPLLSFDKVSQLTGLDPAGLFKYGDFLYSFFNVETFRKGHAMFTDVVHTSAGKFGISGTVGDADFWVNGGETQNGCTAKKSIQDFLADQDINKIDRLACSHRRAWEYYVESVNSPIGAFLSNACAAGSGLISYFNISNCQNAGLAACMGYYSSVGYQGAGLINIDYYTPTNDGTTARYSIT